MGKEYVKGLLDKLEEETRKTERKQTLEEVLDLIDNKIKEEFKDGDIRDYVIEEFKDLKEEIKKLGAD